MKKKYFKCPVRFVKNSMSNIGGFPVCMYQSSLKKEIFVGVEKVKIKLELSLFRSETKIGK